ncbi:Crotonobetainyl-CoA:carnitine CoA-transferase CaiB [Desulfacinum infernum DSM 9756]|uniref:Crotonobetainyl-CoA:carnitine CoA-transferase CaiB n=1 Tax=Desulfacinum infernum DSM 9756 TaxID=1121391 RepID=A0A1M4ZK64_9BACT|nr:CoA transferase [Desulfacinum infernum]SHF18404.1 Crotonobetainyl-CoA:carnitine CoA-transferase CaiB [Desulfacinum infernum DSM 9756]
MAHEDYFDWTERLFDPAGAFSKPEALKGVRVLELCTRVFGPVTADLLADMGAEVIKIELPGVGDLMRYVAPRGFFWQNISPAFTHMNHNKYHVAIDIRKPEGAELLKRLAARSDVLVENFRPGTMDRWGVGYRQLREVNPRLIYQANSGFGQWSVYRDRPSYDATSQAMSGFSATTGFPGRPPLKIGIWIGDYTGALFATLGILAALYHRNKTGEGQMIDVSQGESLIRIQDWTWLLWSLFGKERERFGNEDVAVVPSGIFRCKDGFVGIAALDDGAFAGLCEAMGDPDMAEDPRFALLDARLKDENREAVYGKMRAWAVTQTLRQVEEAGVLYGFSAQRVANARDHYEDEHLRARRAVWELEDPLYGPVVEYGPGPKLSETPGRMRWIAKPVGFHNEYVFRNLLALDPETVERLENEGVVGRWADRIGAKPPEDWDGEKGRFF